MTLNAARLRSDFAAWFRNPRDVASMPQAERHFAATYHAYAKEAEDVSGEKALNLLATRFQTPLNFQGSRTPQQFCAQLDRAFVAYWTGAVFAVGVVPPASPPCPNVGGSGQFLSETSSIVVSVTSRVLYAEILPLVSSLTATAEMAAQQIALAFDRATKRAVTVLITGLDTTPWPPGPLPIYNVCGVF